MSNFLRRSIICICVFSFLLASCSSISSTPVPFYEGNDFSCWTASRNTTTDSSSINEKMLIDAEEQNKPRHSLYILDIQTQSYKQIVPTIDSYELRDNPVSPNGQYLWYIVADKGLHSDVIWIYDLKTNQTVQVPFWDAISTSSNAFEWSANSECLIIWQPQQAIAYRVADGLLQRKIFSSVTGTSASEVRQSFDGKDWAFNCEKGLCIQNQLGNIAYKELSDWKGISLIRWSPNQKQLAIARNISVDPHYGIYGVKLVTLNNQQIDSVKDLYGFDEQIRFIQNMLWSLDGTKLLLNSSSEFTFEVYDTATQTRITLPYQHALDTPAWLSNSQQVAYVSNDQISIKIIDIYSLREIYSIPSPENSTVWGVYQIP